MLRRLSVLRMVAALGLTFSLLGVVALAAVAAPAERPLSPSSVFQDDGNSTDGNATGGNGTGAAPAEPTVADQTGDDTGDDTSGDDSADDTTGDDTTGDDSADDTGDDTGGTATAEGDGTVRPAHIHLGTCAELDPNPAFPLNELVVRGGDDDDSDDDGAGEFMGVEGASEVVWSETDVAVTLDDLLAEPHSINVHLSPEDAGTYIACGEIGGTVFGDDLIIGLRPLDGSGFAGVAILDDDDDDSELDVEVYLAATDENGA